MRANTRRSGALAFGELVEEYDAGRPRYQPDFIEETLERLQCGLGSRQLEVGAGTGQLTKSLLAMNARVTAVEPSPPMAARLRRNLATEINSRQLQVLEQHFEDIGPADNESFAQIWSADAWHWIDPSNGYRLAAELLEPAGHLINTWGFPILTSPDQQTRLNEIYNRLSPDLVRDPGAHLISLEPLLEQGRQEIDESGFMRVIDHWIKPMPMRITRTRYVQWQLSYGHIAALTEHDCDTLAEAIEKALAEPSGEASIDVTVWRYTVAATKA